MRPSGCQNPGLLLSGMLICIKNFKIIHLVFLSPNVSESLSFVKLIGQLSGVCSFLLRGFRGLCSGC